MKDVRTDGQRKRVFLARALAQEGARVCAADINLEGAEETAREAGSNAFAVRVDIQRIVDDCHKPIPAALCAVSTPRLRT